MAYGDDEDGAGVISTGGLSSAKFGGPAAMGSAQRASQLQYQHYNTDAEAGGYLGGGTLARGPRTTQSPNFGFPPPLSAAQNGGGSPKQTMGGGEEE